MIRFLLGTFLLLTPGQSVNFFSLKQDAEIGAESAMEAEQSLQVIKNLNVSQYVGTIAQRVVSNRSLPPLKYRFQIVNSKDINSLGFPGGPIYLYRGLVNIAANDDELAAIVAHEVSHVASRHGTQQLSRQLLLEAPIAIAAGAPISEVWKEQIARLGITLGVDAPFLRYSRDQEQEAGLMAVRLMANAQFDPNAFRSLIEKVNESQAAFLFNHPQSQSFSPEIADEIDRLSNPSRQAHETPGFRVFQTTLQKIGPPTPVKASVVAADAAADTLANVFTHPMDYYRLGYPAGWQVTRTGANGAIIAPADGVQFSGDVNRGVMFDLFDISVADRSFTLEQATNRLMVFLRQRNQSLRIVPGAQTQTLISDEPGLRTIMIGKETNKDSEVAWVVTRLYYQSLFYMVFVAPEDEFPMYQPVFEQMIRSVRLR
jgi:Zn-dependent protease with chaperone function